MLLELYRAAKLQYCQKKERKTKTKQKNPTLNVKKYMSSDEVYDYASLSTHAIETGAPARYLSLTSPHIFLNYLLKPPDHRLYG